MVFTEEEKTVIKFLRQNKNYSVNRLLKEFPNKGWTLGGLTYLVQKIDQTGTVDRRNGSSRRRILLTNDNINAVVDLLQSQEGFPQTHLSQRKIARQLGISPTCVGRIFNKELELKCELSLQLQKPQPTELSWSEHRLRHFPSEIASNCRHSSKLHSKKKKDKTEKKKSHTSSSEGNDNKQSSTKVVKKHLKDVKAEEKPEVKDSSGASPPKVKKPLNAFMLYMRDMRAKVTAEGTCKDSTVINQTIGKKWHSLSVDEQNKYYALANQMRQQHKEMYPSWTARDNYAQHSKKKLKHKTITAKRRPAVSVKKCRARYGLEQQDMWCGPCRRKKRCIRYVEEVSDQERGNEESEEDSTTAITIEEDGPNATDDEDNATIAIEEGTTDSEGVDDNTAITMEEVGIVTDNEDDDSAISVIVEEIPTA